MASVNLKLPNTHLPTYLILHKVYVFFTRNKAHVPLVTYNSLFENMLCHVRPLPSISCVNRRQYNSRYRGTALGTSYFPVNERICNNGSDVFCAVRAAETIRGAVATRESIEAAIPCERGVEYLHR
jgi:hypothetical protein